MKKNSLILIMILTFGRLYSQNVDDALRYSQVFYGGTARFISMGSAFTALGGDLSTLSQNPAGIGVFRSSEVTVSPQLYHIKTKANFNGISEDYLYNFNLSQAGVVTSLISRNDQTGLINLNFGYSYNRTNNYNTSVRIEGIQSRSSMADYWADISSGKNYRDLGGAAGIAYDAWVIDTITGTGPNYYYGTVFSNYGDNPPSVYGQRVRRIITNNGYSGEHAFSIGGNISNKIFFGATLGINRISFTGHYEHLEDADYSLVSGFRNFTYTDHYENTGTGISFKIGTIVKPAEYVRIGFAFHSPVYFRIDEYFYDNISSNFEGNEHYEFSNEAMRYSYALTTPFRAMGGIAVQIKKYGLLSAEYEFVDYATARFSETGDGYDYSEKNLQIKNSLKSTGNLRLGGELRLDKFYLRGGYGYYGKSFKQGEDNENLDYSSVTLGAGFREKNISIDFGFAGFRNPQKYILYTSDAGDAIANMNTARNTFTLSVGYKFGY